MTPKDYLTVSQLTSYIKAKFDRDPYMQTVHLVAEVSGFRNRGKQAHQYFGLKDDQAYINAIIFRHVFSKLNFDLEDGMKVQVIGRISLYEKSGRYSLIIDAIQPDGVGQFYVRFEELKKKLTQEGLFTFQPKPLAKYPKKIAVVTSPSGAVIRDIITTCRRRYPIVQIVLYPTVVQGEQAAQSIVKNIQRADQSGAYDTIIVGRGGGSIEDLWCFNEEKVVRAIAACQTPVISSVGHETDTTLSDYVADQRAATPTAAAELATPVLKDVFYQLGDYRQRLIKSQTNRLDYFEHRLGQVKQSYLFTQPEKLYDGYRLKIADLDKQLSEHMRQKVYQHKETFYRLYQGLYRVSPERKIVDEKHRLQQEHADLCQSMEKQLKDIQHTLSQRIGQLDLLSPLKRMSGGYAYVSQNGQSVLSVTTLSPGQNLDIQFRDGRLSSQITATYKQEMVPSAFLKGQGDQKKRSKS